MFSNLFLTMVILLSLLDFNIPYKEYTLLSSLPNRNIGLYVLENATHTDQYNEFLLDIDGDLALFSHDWSSVRGSINKPILVLRDLTDDRIHELAVINTSATGTGIRLQNIHIININPLDESMYKTEYSIANPQLIIKNNITTRLNLTSSGMEIVFDIGDKKYTVKKGIHYKQYTDSSIYFDNVLKWKVENDKIYAYIDAQLHGIYIGTIIIEYEYISDNKTFNFGRIFFDSNYY